MSDDPIKEIANIVASNASKQPKAIRSYSDLQIYFPSMQEAQEIEGTQSFKKVLASYLQDTNNLQHGADAEIQRMVAGEAEDLHEVTMAMDEAEAAFDLMMEIRNKLVGAYQEVMRMQV
jgi:flagellar hook-basal body complex protein FliE